MNNLWSDMDDQKGNLSNLINVAIDTECKFGK